VKPVSLSPEALASEGADALAQFHSRAISLNLPLSEQTH
jgi:hypothetical protein